MPSVPALLLPAGRSSATLSTEVEALIRDIEEADDRLVLHCAWELDCGSDRLLGISNDTDTVVRLLCLMPQLRERGLHEL